MATVDQKRQFTKDWVDRASQDDFANTGDLQHALEWVWQESKSDSQADKAGVLQIVRDAAEKAKGSSKQAMEDFIKSCEAELQLAATRREAERTRATAAAAKKVRTLGRDVRVSLGKQEAESTLERKDAEVNDADGAKKKEARIRLLSDLDNESGVERSNASFFERGSQRYIIGERQLYNILKTELSTRDLDTFLGGFGLKDIDWSKPESYDRVRQEFQTELIARADRMASVSRFLLGDKDAGAGLVAVIRGTEPKAFAESILSNRVKAKEIKTEVDSGSSLGRDILMTLASVGVSFTTFGLVHTSFESRDLDPEKWGHPLAYVLGDDVNNSRNFTAKLRIVSAALQANWNDRESEIIRHTSAFAKGLENKNPNDKTRFELPEDAVFVADSKEKSNAEDLVKVYNDYLDRIPEGGRQALIDELTRLRMLALATKWGGYDFKGVEVGVNLLSPSAYLAVTGQNITTRVQSAGESGATYTEGLLVHEKSELTKLHIEKTTYMDPATKESHGAYVLPVKLEDIKDLNNDGIIIDGERVLLISDEPLDFYEVTVYLQDGSVEKRLHIGRKSDRGGEKTVALTVVVKDAQESRGEEMQKLWDAIYRMSRHRSGNPSLDTAFDTILQQIGKGEYKTAYEGLTRISQHKTIRSILALLPADSTEDQKRALLQAINTYTYGSKAKNANSLDAWGYKKSRTQKVIDAENALWLPNEKAEKSFAGLSNHKRKALKDMDVFSGQPLSVSVYATPYGGKHRIDRYEGSIEVDEHVYGLKDGEVIVNPQRQSILDRHAQITTKKLQDINSQLKQHGIQITSGEYDEILKTGKIPEQLAKRWLSFAVDKGGMFRGPKFFEARAMVNGNVCMNRVEGIAYPLFDYLPPATDTVTTGAAAPVGRKIGEVVEGGVGAAFGIPGADRIGGGIFGGGSNQSSRVGIGTTGGANAGWGK